MAQLFRNTSGLLSRLQLQVKFYSNAPAAKSNLAVLRRNTGYSFSLCKKALETNNNDVTEAEKWLNQQAANLEWSKNKNVTARKTSQGLIGLKVESNSAVLFELNCETDFVARNENFINLLNLTGNACLDFVSKNLASKENVLKTNLDTEELKKSSVIESGKPLQDHINLSIETIKENITLGRAMGFKVSGSAKLVGVTHPLNTLDNSVFYGKYAAVLALKSSSELNPVIAKNLCQHIVGLNPKKVGQTGVDEPNSDADSEECLIFQEFVLDPSKTVKEVLEENQIQVLDFHRFACDDEKN